MLICDLRKKIRYIQHDTDTDDIMFTFNEGSVKDNRFKYCPYCGKEVTEEEKELNND